MTVRGLAAGEGIAAGRGMSWVLSLGRSSFAIAFGVLIGATAALYGVRSAVNRVVIEDVVEVVPAGPAVQTVDVSRSALDRVGALDGLVAMLGLRPGERVVAIGGVAAGLGSLGAAWLAAAPGDYLDLEVMPANAPSTGPRRVLVLVHP